MPIVANYPAAHTMYWRGIALRRSRGIRTERDRKNQEVRKSVRLLPIYIDENAPVIRGILRAEDIRHGLRVPVFHR